MTDNDKKIELINAMVALRRYHDTVLLRSFLTALGINDRHNLREAGGVPSWLARRGIYRRA